MLKNIFNAVKGLSQQHLPHRAHQWVFGDRYIKLDGSPYDVPKGWQSILYRPEVKIGALWGLAQTAMVMMSEGTMDVTNAKVMSEMIDSITGGAIAVAVIHLFMHKDVEARIPKSSKAIDTREGTKSMPAQLNASDQAGLKYMKSQAGAFMLWILGFNSLMMYMNYSADPQNFNAVEDIAVSTAAYLTLGLTMFERAQALMNGHGIGTPRGNREYVFCEEPPKQRVREKASDTVRGGVGAGSHYTPVPIPVTAPAGTSARPPKLNR